ncbi:bifunctional tetrahydrofolate synthase/dihydrofolate synthase [Alteromonas antoniana]|uniref:bifunctional tetrahydrofolate synthase/dihydrofolate synthase n=1 Tax=Alteromonas antoniana TaxID=2803813 RepID=UPI001C45C829|nr:bifunctional tetrahydrofolate synthase/dihydrofolate synthase [Alteromonas antoniana]
MPAPADRSLAQWLTYLESIHPSAIDMGLERVETVAATLGLTFTDRTVITVAGTNGKGTTCKFLEQAAIAQGKSVAVYSSPHLLTYRERVRYNGELPTEAAFCEAFTCVEAARGDTTLTYFEFGTLAAMKMMMEWQADIVILEVGLGGRLDATNIVDPDIAVITTIDLDHQDWLGDTREKIAVEKAGIMRPGIKAVIGDRQPPSTLHEEVTRFQAKALWAERDFTVTEHQDGWDWHCGEVSLKALPKPVIPLQNAATALATLHQLGWLPDAKEAARVIANTEMAGRRQQLDSAPRVVVDVGHNPQATRQMMTWLSEYQYDNLYIVAGMLKDKSIVETLAPFESLDATWLLAATSGPRGLSAEALQSGLPVKLQKNSQTFASVEDAYAFARSNCAQSDMIFVFGSFLTVADVLALHTYP